MVILDLHIEHFVFWLGVKSNSLFHPTGYRLDLYHSIPTYRVLSITPIGAEEIWQHFAFRHRNGYSEPGFCVCYAREGKVYHYFFFPPLWISCCGVSLSEYTITMYDTKSRELRWNATYSDYASTLPDDDTKYSKTLVRSSGLFGALWRTVLIPYPLFGRPQRWLTLCPTATVSWLLWIMNPEMSSGFRTTTLQWWPCTFGSARASAKFLTPTWPWKPCGTSRSCPERAVASPSGNTHFPKRRNPKISSCKKTETDLMFCQRSLLYFVCYFFSMCMMSSKFQKDLVVHLICTLAYYSKSSDWPKHVATFGVRMNIRQSKCLMLGLSLNM